MALNEQAHSSDSSVLDDVLGRQRGDSSGSSVGGGKASRGVRRTMQALLRVLGWWLRAVCIAASVARLSLDVAAVGRVLRWRQRRLFR